MAKKDDKAASTDYREEISFLRQKFGSLVIRGSYKECFKLIEDNIKLLYFKERWPENFLANLAFHKRSYPAMDIPAHYNEYLTALLAKNGIPTILVQLMKPGVTTVWSAENFKEQAIEAQREERHEEALGYADLMIKMDPLSSGAYLLKGWMLRDLKRDAEAIACYERALEYNKNNFQARSALAEIYAATNPKKALEFILEAIASSPGIPDLQATKAKILLTAGDKEGAIDAYDQAYLLDPLNPEYIFQRAEIMISIPGQDLAAMRQYQKVFSVNESHLPTHKRLAALLAETQPETALAHVSRVVDAHPKNLAANLLKAQLHAKVGHVGPAIRQYGNVIELDENCATAYGGLGKLHQATEPQKALPYWQKAVACEPQNPEYLIGKGSCHERLGEKDAAVATYKEAIELDKTSAKAYASLGVLLSDSDPAASLGYLNKAIALAPETAHYHQAKGELLLKAPGKDADALESFDKAARYDPGNAALRRTLGALLEKSGNIASAVEHYRTAVSLDTKQEEAFYALARLLRENEPESAITYINAAINLNMLRADYYYLKSLIYIRLGQKPDAIRSIMSAVTDDKRNVDSYQELRQLMDGETPRVGMMYINRALELSPKNSVFLCVRARIYGDMGRTQDAMDQFRKVTDVDPQEDSAWFGIGYLLAQDGSDDKKALEYFDKAIALAPGNARYLVEKGKVLARDPKAHGQALSCYDDAIARDNYYCDALLFKAYLLEEQEELYEAMECYKRALLINRKCVEASAKLGMLLADINPQAALQYLDTTIELAPGNYTHHIWRARVLYALGEEEAAGQAVQEALRLGGQEEEVQEALDGQGAGDELYYMLARILHGKMPEVAMKYCLKAIELAPENAEYMLLRGNIHLRLREETAARNCYAKALELDPSSHEALARTAELHYRKDNPAALGMIDRAIAINGGNATYYYVRALILSEMEDDRTQDAIACVREAIELAPASTLYREKLLELLQKGGSRWQRFLEGRKLKKLVRKLEKARAQYVK